MPTRAQLRNAEHLVREDRSDEDIERLTGVDLSQILAMRARFAATTTPAQLAMRRYPERAASLDPSTRHADGED